MDLSTILADTLNFPIESPSKLGLLLSHATSSHEPVLCDLISQISKTKFVGIKPPDKSGDQSNRSTYTLLVASRKSAQFYNRLLGLTMVNPDPQRVFKIVELAQFDHLSCALDSDSPLGLKMLDRIKDEINIIMDQARQKHPSIVHIFIDNLTCLIDLGCNLRQIDNLLNRCLSNTDCPCLVILGCHLGIDWKDSLSSEMEPNLVYAIQLWKARSSVVIEMQPLSTGYTASLDGQMSIFKRPKTDEQTTQEATQLFHYKYEGKRVMCYAPGTSKLLT